MSQTADQARAGRIAVLDAAVIDQIAAGEVVERPASVVKELVENALDAGACSISVEVEGGGKRLIRVVDDGTGMTPAEALLALRRHATSKLRGIDDLEGIGTMGFRGEALPSIAAVSRLTLTTRTRDAVAGTRLEVHGGTLVSQREAGAPVGTVTEVRDLLYNIPARLKFLKGEATESSHITDAVSKLAMAHPAVHLRLRHGARTTVDAPPHPSGYERARALLGARLGARLHAARGEENGVEVEAYLVSPALAVSTSRAIQLYVGRRAVRDRGLMHAIVMGYGELIPKGKYPAAVVFVRVPAPDVDVNVHPQKLEVRFSDAQRVYAAVRHTVQRAAASAPWLADRVDDGAPVRMRPIASSPVPRASEVALGYASATERALLPFGRRRPTADDAAAARVPAGTFGGGRRDDAVAHTRAPRPSTWPDDGPVSLPRAPRASDPPTPAPTAAGPRGPDESAGQVAGAAPVGEASARASGPQPAPDVGSFFTDLRYLGQLDRTYLLCERAGELVVVDQHAAHERVEFERLRERHASRALPIQRLLFPQRVELSRDESTVVADCGDELAAVGFELEPFGGDSYAIKAVPAGLRGAEPEAVLRELLGELIDQGGSQAVSERLDLVLATIACHSVVRAGDALSPREAEALLASMDQVELKAHCPHGRPVLLRISVAEMARRFGR